MSLKLAAVPILFAVIASADVGCPAITFSSARSATLQPTPNTHRVLLKEKDGSYTALELKDSSPYSLVGKTPHFEKQLTACAPSGNGLTSIGVLAVAQTPSGGYILATQTSSNEPVDIAVFDASFRLTSEATYVHIFTPLVFADVNGDGILDLVGITYEMEFHPLIAVALGNGSANFPPPAEFDFSGVAEGADSVDAIAVADINGDGKLDIIASLSEEGSILLLAGNGNGTFQQAKIVLRANNPGDIAVADLNGDGIPDLVFSDSDSNLAPLVDVALGLGKGTFAKLVSYPGGAGVTIADVDGDGIPDIVTGGVTILFGDGKGGFPVQRQIAVETNQPQSPIVTDFNGDGIPDIVLGVGSPSVIAGDLLTVVRGLGNRQFDGPAVSTIPKFPNADSLFTAMSTGDVNGDGIPDVVLADDFGDVSVLLGNGDGTFRSGFQYHSSAGIVYSVLLADFNNDGLIDLAVAGSGYQLDSTAEVDILLGKGDGAFQTPQTTSTPLGSLQLAAGDFNRDGKLDLALLVQLSEVMNEPAGTADSVVILLGGGDGTFQPGQSYTIGDSAQAIVAGDFNGDGKPDLAISYEDSQALGNHDGIALLEGFGDGTFANPKTIPMQTSTTRGLSSLVAADFNRDGKLDLAFPDREAVLTMLGNGDGTFQAPIYNAVDASHVTAVDLNNDGIQDLAVLGGSGIFYLLGNGDGSFQPPVNPFAESYVDGGTPIAIGDFNLDGRLDIAAPNAAGLLTLLNTTMTPPSLTVVPAASLVAGPIAPESIATAFGSGLPTTAPTVSIVDSTGSIFAAHVLYSSSTQVNFAVPPDLDAGPATVTIGSKSTNILVAPVAPSLFTVNSAGLAAGYVTRIASGGAQTNEPIVAFKNGAYSPVPIDVMSGQVYLILFGTGIRNAAQPGILGLEVVFAGPQGEFTGLDQVNVQLPSSLAGSGCLDLTLSLGVVYTETIRSNTVYVCIK